ncbi:hypothetical protein I4U23_028962 [Adineta vaga]|nr:hypothetical protein I4U23_028962 [Adineta vaga]
MLSRLNFLRRGFLLPQLILTKSRSIHFTRILANANDSLPPPPPPSPPVSPLPKKKDPTSTSIRSHLSASEISELVLRRLHFHEQRGVVKALIIGAGIVIVSTVLFLYVFRTPLKNQTVAQVADVARSSLEQDSVRQQVNLLSQELIQNLLADPNILSKALLFLEHVMDNPSTKDTLIRLLQRLMTDNEMQKNVSEFTSQIIYDVMKKPETEIQLGHLFRRAILQKDNQDALYILLKEFIDSEKTKEILTNLAREVAHQVLNDESVKITATTFVKDILNDTGLQQQSGDFAWNAVKNALKPKWFTSHAKTSTMNENQKVEENLTESDFENSIILPPFSRASSLMMSYLYGPRIIKDKILTNISAAIREIHRLAVDNEDQTSRVITNDDWQVHCLLEHLDFALLYGLKYVQDGYYKCVSDFTPKLLLEQIESLLNIETNLGRGRAWFFLALNDSLTESYMKCFQDNRKLVKKFYTSDSIINDTQRLIALTTLCSGLENIQFNLKSDCVYFDRSCWPAYLQVDIKETEKLSLPGVRNDVPSFTTYLSRYDVQHLPSTSAVLNNAIATSKRMRVPKKTTRSSTTSSVVNSYISSDIHTMNLSRSSSVSFDNPSIDGSSLNEENQGTNTLPITTDSPLALPNTKPELSSSLSELDPIFNVRPRTPSPIPSTMVEESVISLIPDDKSSVIDTIDNPSIPIEIQPSVIVEESKNTFELPENSVISSSSTSIDMGLNELSIERKNDDLFQNIPEDALDMIADANMQLQLTLEVYEMENKEKFIKLFPTIIGHNNGNPEVVFLLITTMNVYLLRQVNEINGSYRLDKIESIRIEQIDYIEVGPNEQFLRIITIKHTKLRCLTTGSIELTKAICTSIREAADYGRFPEPQVLPATMQEISIKKELANDLKKNSVHDVKLLDYHYIFWEEPQMSGRKLRKEGHLFTKLVEPPSAMKRLSAATLKSHRQPFEGWRNAYVTLRVDRLNIYLHKSDSTPALSYTLLDENCQGCRRNRNTDRPHAIEIMFANDVKLVMAAKSKSDQDEWLNAIMKGLSQGRIAMKDEENTANTVPCSVMLTEEKIYVCHDEQDNALIRQLDSIKLDYIARLFVDSHCPYYCVLTIEQGNHGSKSWIFYFLFTKEMVQFIKSLQAAVSHTYQVPIDIQPLNDLSFQRECERTSKLLLRSYRPLQLIS